MYIQRLQTANYIVFLDLINLIVESDSLTIFDCSKIAQYGHHFLQTEPAWTEFKHRLKAAPHVQLQYLFFAQSLLVEQAEYDMTIELLMQISIEQIDSECFALMIADLAQVLSDDCLDIAQKIHQKLLLLGFDCCCLDVVENVNVPLLLIELKESFEKQNLLELFTQKLTLEFEHGIFQGEDAELLNQILNEPKTDRQLMVATIDTSSLTRIESVVQSHINRVKYIVVIPK